MADGRTLGFLLGSRLPWKKEDTVTQSYLKLRLINFGLKEVQEIPKADLYLDCRGIMDPSWQKGHGGSGDNPSVQEKVKASSPMTIMALRNVIEEAVSGQRIPLRRSEDKDPYEKPFVVAFMCAHGIHRSRAAKHIVGDLLKKAGYNVEIGGVVK